MKQASDLTPQQQGRAWEPEFAKSIGGEPVSNSGAGFYKLDVRGISILWSLKWAGKHSSFRVEDKMFTEALLAIHGPGGPGGMIPGIAYKTKGGEFMVFRKGDALAMLTDGTPIASVPTHEAIDLSKRKPSIDR